MCRAALIAEALLMAGARLAETQPVGDRVEVNGMPVHGRDHPQARRDPQGMVADVISPAGQRGV